MGLHICTQPINLFAMSSLSYLYARWLTFVIDQGCGGMLSYIFIMAIEPTTLIYVVLADRHGYHSQLEGAIESVLVTFFYFITIGCHSRFFIIFCDVQCVFGGFCIEY